MSIRMGVTAAEEKKLIRAIEDGLTWKEILVVGTKEGDTEPPILTDVHEEYVYKEFYLPLAAAKKARDDAKLAEDIGAVTPKK